MDQQDRTIPDADGVGRSDSPAQERRDLLPTIPQEDVAVATLNAIGRGVSLVTIIAESGAGKSVVAGIVADELRERGFPVIEIPQQGRSTRAILMHQVALQLGIAPDLLTRAPDNVAARLLGNAMQEPFALVLDDADWWPADVMRSVVALAGERRDGAPLLHAVLIGSVQLRAHVPAALDGQVSLSIPPLTLRQAREYIARRFALAGGSVARRMSPLAVDEVLLRAGGNPRRIDRLTDECLALATGQVRRFVTPATVHGVGRMAGDGPLGRLRRAMPLLLSGLAGTALVVTGITLVFGVPDSLTGLGQGRQTIEGTAPLADPASPPEIVPSMTRPPVAIPPQPRLRPSASVQGTTTQNRSPPTRPDVAPGAVIPAPQQETPAPSATAGIVQEAPPLRQVATVAAPSPVASQPRLAATLMTVAIPRVIGNPIAVVQPDVAPGRVALFQSLPARMESLPVSPAEVTVPPLPQPEVPLAEGLPVPPAPPARTGTRADRGFDGPVVMHRLRGRDTMQGLLARIYGRDDAAAQALFRSLNPGLEGQGPWPSGLVAAVPQGIRHGHYAKTDSAARSGGTPPAVDDPVGETRSLVPYFCRSILPQNGAEDAYTRQVCAR